MRSFRVTTSLHRSVLIALLLVAAPASSFAAIDYTISLADPTHHHLVEVQIFLPPGAAEREIQLPVWNALYQVRDFAQYVNWGSRQRPIRAPVAGA